MSNELQQLIASAGGGSAPFMGKHVHSLDPKKRLTIPSVWRDVVGEAKSLYLMPGIDRPCLMLLPPPVMAQLMQRMEGMHLSDPEEMELMLTVASESDHLSFDAQGRVRVNDEHLGFAGLEGEVVLAGAFNRIELWNPDAWAARKKSASGLSTAAKSLKM
jgi:MraZ protein